MHSDDSRLDSQSIAHRVRDLMARHGVAKRAQSTELSRILGLSFSAASRKMKGQLPWTIEQLGEVAAHFEEPPSVLIEGLPSDQTESGQAAEAAILMMEAREWPCMAWIGKELGPRQHAELVAIRVENKWHIYPSERAPIGRWFTIEVIEMRPGQGVTDRPTVAVVDDDRAAEAADSLADFLNDQGFNATPYYEIAGFCSTTEQLDFDAFVLDWLYEGETAEAAIRNIRHTKGNQIPIFLLTGQIDAGNVDEEDIARVIRAFDVTCLEKPTRPAVLAAELERKLGLR